jgi:hypothetical protein
MVEHDMTGIFSLEDNSMSYAEMEKVIKELVKKVSDLERIIEIEDREKSRKAK